MHKITSTRNVQCRHDVTDRIGCGKYCSLYATYRSLKPEFTVPEREEHAVRLQNDTYGQHKVMSDDRDDESNTCVVL